MSPNRFRVDGKVALVTGGNKGLGAAMASRWGSPDDMVGPALFLASDASDFVYGHVLVVDGGWMAR